MPFDESNALRTPCTTQTPVIKQYAGECKTHTLTVTDTSGNAIDLTTLGACTPSYHGVFDQEHLSSSSSSALALIADTVTVCFTVTDCYSSSNSVFTLDGTITDAENGTVEITIGTENSNYTGLFLGALLAYVNGVLRYVTPYYFEFVVHAGAMSSGPITISEVRLELYDTCADANYLIDELEFTDTEIFHCMKKAVDEWNDAIPPVSIYNYRNFPYRSAWLKASAAHLLNMIAHKYRRNSLDYSSGGVSIRDQWRWKAYQDRAQELLGEYYNWVKNRKMAINIAGCDGYTGSDYRGA